MTKLCEHCPDHEACMTGVPCVVVKAVQEHCQFPPPHDMLCSLPDKEEGS